VSVVVPVYKVEDYLDACVRSILGQTYNELEILLVDDGSPDRCGQMCDAWAERDTRVRALHKPNGGLSDARNYGLERATGEWIIFVDSDDELVPSCVDTSLNAALETGAECVIFRPNYVDEAGVPLPKRHDNNVDRFPHGTLAGSEACAGVLEGRFPDFAWSLFARRSVYKDTLFPVGRTFEDILTTYRVLLNCKHVTFVGNDLYLYRQRKGSILHSDAYKRESNWIRAMQERLRDIRANHPELVPSAMYGYYNALYPTYSNYIVSINGLGWTRDLRKLNRDSMRLRGIMSTALLPGKEKAFLCLAKLHLLELLRPVMMWNRRRLGTEANV
jgi:glycosyltransferase involved in cell wall biosynthesis